MSGNVKLSVTENRVLDTCCMMEETCAALYRYFAELFADNQSVSALWSITAQEEDSHAEQFRLAYRLQGAGIESLKSDVARANDLLAKMEGVYKKVQENKPTLCEAFTFAIKLEYALARYHMDAIANFGDKNLEQLFVSMRKVDLDHISRLERMYAEMFP